MPPMASESILIHDSMISEVFADNLYTEFEKVRKVVKQFPYVALDTEFPGVVCRPNGTFTNSTDYMYQGLKVNSDVLKIIQVGFTFFDKNGNVPHPTCTWQFNFQFNTDTDMFAEDSILLLKQSGIKFEEHNIRGIYTDEFCELLVTSGIVLNPKITFLSFQSGADFCYLVKMLTNQELPSTLPEFTKICRTFFPNFYDVKSLWSSVANATRCNMGRGLEDLSDHFEVIRLGQQHQAGSDSYVTGKVFFALLKKYFEDELFQDQFKCQISGLFIDMKRVFHYQPLSTQFHPVGTTEAPPRESPSIKDGDSDNEDA